MVDHAFLRRYAEDPRLHVLLILGRISNALRFAIHAGVSVGDSDTPSAHRQRQASFFYLCGILAEGFRFLPKVGQYFRHAKSYQQQLKPLLNDPEYSELRSKYLAPLRNEAIYHNDLGVVAEGVRFLGAPQQTFADAETEQSDHVRYGLSDLVTLTYFLVPQLAGELTNERFLAELERVHTQTTQLADKVCLAIDDVVGEALAELRGGAGKEPP